MQKIHLLIDGLTDWLITNVAAEMSFTVRSWESWNLYPLAQSHTVVWTSLQTTLSPNLALWPPNDSLSWLTFLKNWIFLFFFFFNFYCYSITVVCLFSPSLHPTPAEPISIPHLHPPLDFVHVSFIVVAKWNKPDGEGQIPYDLTFNQNIINRRKKQTKCNQRHWS